MSSAEESEAEDVIAVSQLESVKTDSPLKSIAQDQKKKPEEEGLLVHMYGTGGSGEKAGILYCWVGMQNVAQDMEKQDKRPVIPFHVLHSASPPCMYIEK